MERSKPLVLKPETVAERAARATVTPADIREAKRLVNQSGTPGVAFDEHGVMTVAPPALVRAMLVAKNTA